MVPSAHPDAPSATDAALSAYESLAPFYDLFTADSAYRPVLEAIEAWAQAQGLRGKRLLDVACGTGKSFEPLLDKGYAVTGCDLSPSMIAEAQRKWGHLVDLVVADMRALPWHDEFDLITCLDDSVNYLLTRADLRAAVRNFAAALRPGGIAVFDTNTIGAYRTDFATSFRSTVANTRFVWRGECDPSAQPGVIARATVTVQSRAGRRESQHVQRHWSISELRSACVSAGFRQVVFRGLAQGPQLVGEPDEERHAKLVCLAAHPRRMGARRGLPVIRAGPTPG